MAPAPGLRPARRLLHFLVVRRPVLEGHIGRGRASTCERCVPRWDRGSCGIGVSSIEFDKLSPMSQGRLVQRSHQRPETIGP
jgi:hypothetical protein